MCHRVKSMEAACQLAFVAVPTTRSAFVALFKPSAFIVGQLVIRTHCSVLQEFGKCNLCILPPK